MLLDFFLGRCIVDYIMFMINALLKVSSCSSSLSIGKADIHVLIPKRNCLIECDGKRDEFFYE